MRDGNQRGPLETCFCGEGPTMAPCNLLAVATMTGRPNERAIIKPKVRLATPDDVHALFAMKRQLVAVEKTEDALRATPQDWLRDGFGPHACFTAMVAEHNATLIGMV